MSATLPKLLDQRALAEVLTDRDREILGELDAACRNYTKLGTDGWVQPIDCGGQNGSDHSYRLSKLARLGLAESRQRGGWSRGSKSYRITDIGIVALKPDRDNA